MDRIACLLVSSPSIQNSLASVKKEVIVDRARKIGAVIRKAFKSSEKQEACASMIAAGNVLWMVANYSDELAKSHVERCRELIEILSSEKPLIEEDKKQVDFSVDALPIAETFRGLLTEGGLKTASAVKAYFETEGSLVQVGINDAECKLVMESVNKALRLA